MAFFLTGALLGAAAASNANDRDYRRMQQQQMYQQNQAGILQAQAEARAAKEYAEKSRRDATGSIVTVTIPQGVTPGGSFQITLSTGQTFYVTCPPGFSSGMPLQVQVPPTPIVMASATPASAPAQIAPPQGSGREILRSSLESTPPKKQLLPPPPAISATPKYKVAFDHIVDESDPVYSSHNIISLRTGDVVTIIGGSFEKGMDPPYSDYVTVSTEYGNSGKVSRHCLTPIN